MNASPSVFVQPVRYLVSCLPEGHPERSHFTVQVQYWDGWWTVRCRSRLLRFTGTWSWPFSSADVAEMPVDDPETELSENRRMQWLAAHRFDRDTALALAKKAAAELRSESGLCVADLLAAAGPKRPRSEP